MFVVDTNVLVYAANADSPAHERCHDLLSRWQGRQGAWYLTWGICYEFMRVVTHPNVLKNPWTLRHANQFLSALRSSPGLRILSPADRHAGVLAEVIEEVPLLAGNVLHDTSTAVLMREHGIRRICTRDTDFHRFTFLEPIDPLTSEP